MPDTILSSQDDFHTTITVAPSTPGREQPAIAGGSDITSDLDDPVTDDALIFSEIDRLLATAFAMAQHYERNSVSAAIMLAMRINRMDYEGRRFERSDRDE
jgi:hypothetical protein